MSLVSKPNTFQTGTVADASAVNANFDAIFNDHNGNITDANISPTGITTYGKVSGSALSTLGNINSGAGLIPAANIPTLNQNTTGTASNVTGTVAIANGGTGQTTANTALNALLPAQGTASGKFLTSNGADASWASIPSPGLSLVSTTTTNIPSNGGYTSNITIDPTKKYWVYFQQYPTNSGGNPPTVRVESLEFNSDTGNNYIKATGVTKVANITITATGGQQHTGSFYLDFVEIVKTTLSVKMAIVRDGESTMIGTGASPFSLSRLDILSSFNGVYQGASSPTTMRFYCATGSGESSTSIVRLYELSQ